MREFQLKQTGNAAYASLIGHVGRSFTTQDEVDKAEWLNQTVDMFHVNPHSRNMPKLTQLGNWDPDDPNFCRGHWCFDTPGTVNKNQVIHIS